MSPASILVVDDEPGVLLSLQAILTRDGHEVVAVDSGEAAVEQIAARDFDLALIDLKLKGIGGIEVLTTLRQKSPGTVAIILTAHATLETAVTALRHGAHDYLFKPCRTVELRESVRAGLLKREQAHLQPIPVEQPAVDSGPEVSGAPLPKPSPRKEPGAGATRFLQRAGLIIDIARHLVTLDGHLLELSPTEFDILTYLANEAPRVVPAQELVQEVQGYTSEPWEARDVIRYHIHRVRHKIFAATGRTGVIHTVRGVGYALEL
jgi:DNA-binding response OmpR family regulator